MWMPIITSRVNSQLEPVLPASQVTTGQMFFHLKSYLCMWYESRRKGKSPFGDVMHQKCAAIFCRSYWECGCWSPTLSPCGLLKITPTCCSTKSTWQHAAYVLLECYLECEQFRCNVEDYDVTKQLSYKLESPLLHGLSSVINSISDVWQVTFS